jgi:PAS domain S-box-containing protein
MQYGSGNELEKLDIAMEAAGVAWWWMELPTGAVFFAPNKAHMLGRNPEDFIHYNNFTELVHPDDYEHMMQAMRDHLEGRAERYETRYRIECADGTYKTFYDRGKVVSKKANGDIALAGMVFDLALFSDMATIINSELAPAA